MQNNTHFGIEKIQGAARRAQLHGSVNDHVAMHQALNRMGIPSTLHHFRAHCAQGTIRHILTGVALEVREGVFLLTGERGWPEVRTKVASQLNTASKSIAFSHHAIETQPVETPTEKIDELMKLLKSV